MCLKSKKSEPRLNRTFAFSMNLILLTSIAVIILPQFLSSASAGTVHGIIGSVSTFDEDNGPNDADPAPLYVRWDNLQPDHFIEGNYTVNMGYTLTIDSGCNILFNGTYKITVEGTLNAIGTTGSRITFTSNRSIPAIGDWLYLEFLGGAGNIQYCDIQYAQEGLHIDSKSPIKIENNTITNNDLGIYGNHPFLNLTNNNISNNNISGVRLDGLFEGLSFYARDNIIVGNQKGMGGIVIFSPIGDIKANILDCEISENGENGIYIYSDIGDITATMVGNEIHRNGYEGIYIVNSGDKAVLNTTIQNNNITNNSYGIWLTNDWIGQHTRIKYNISKNNIIDNGDGIYVDCWGSISGEVWNNNLINNQGDGGIYSQNMDGDCNYSIIDNVIKDNNAGIYLEYFYLTKESRVLYAEISDNRIINNSGFAIDIYSDEYMDLNVERNEVYGNDFGLDAFSYGQRLDCQINDNAIHDNYGVGIAVNALNKSFISMQNNQVNNNWGGNFLLYGDGGGTFEARNIDFSESRYSDGVYITYKNGDVLLENINVSGNAQSGFTFWDSPNMFILNATCENNQNGIYSYNSNITIINSSISSTIYDFNLTSDSHIISLNTTFDNSSSNFLDSKSNLTVLWYLNVKVVNGGGFGVDNADCWVNDSFGENVWSRNTQSGNDGWIILLPATEYVENASDKIFHTPHNVSAKREPEFGFSLSNIWKSQDVIVAINSNPVGTDIWPAGGITQSVFRNDTIFIHANCSDFLDSEEKLTPHFEYRNPFSSTWDTTYFSSPPNYKGSAPSGYWSIPFFPPVSGFLGWYDFRVRFNDTTGALSEYIYSNDSLAVKNNPPKAINMIKENDTVLRSSSILIYANATDLEDSESQLVPHFEYNDPDSTGWATDYLSGTGYSNGQWYVVFHPFTDAKLGTYDFRVRFSDLDGNFSDYLIVNDFIEVQNNAPSGKGISFSDFTVLRNETIFIYADGEDMEDQESDLIPIFECKRSESTIWTMDYLMDPIYIGGQWRINFTSFVNAPLGNYDFRVRFLDLDNALSNWIYENGSVSVENNLPQAEEISVTAKEVFRGDFIYVFANASDVEENEDALIPEFSYRVSGGLWANTSFTEMIYINGAWRIRFSPLFDMALNDYIFRVGFYDNDYGFSGWLTLSGIVTVLNSPPKVNISGISSPQIYRTESVIIHAEIYDAEDSSSDITPTFQYRTSGSSNWEDLKDWSYNLAEGHFKVSFITSAIEELGLYDFRIRAEDLDGDTSPWYYLNGSLEVQNNIPLVLNLTLSSLEIFRGEDVYLYSDAEDGDKDEEDLVPFFEYSLDGETWDNLFFGDPEYKNGRWEVLFSPQIIAELGKYSFRVRVSDSVTHSDWKYENGILDIKNNLPYVVIETSGHQDGASVSFTATVSDLEDDRSSLTFLWDFGDGATSSEQNPIHTYEDSGSYTVTLTVTDNDGGEAFNTSFIEVYVEGSEPEPDGDQEDVFPLWILVVLILVISAVLILLFVLLKRKKSEKEVWLPEFQEEGDSVLESQIKQPPPAQTAISIPAVSQPPPSPPPPTSPAEFKDLVTKNIKCPRCDKIFQVQLQKGSNTIKCPHCGISGNVKV